MSVPEDQIVWWEYIRSNLARHVRCDRRDQEQDILGRLAALVVAGLLSEATLYDALHGVFIIRPRRHVPYLLTILENDLPDLPLRRLLRTVQLPQRPRVNPFVAELARKVFKRINP